MARLCTKAVSIAVAALIVLAAVVRSQVLDPFPTQGCAAGAMAISGAGDYFDSVGPVYQEPFQRIDAGDRWKPHPPLPWPSDPGITPRPLRIQRDRGPNPGGLVPLVHRARLCCWLI